MDCAFVRDLAGASLRRRKAQEIRFQARPPRWHSRRSSRCPAAARPIFHWAVSKSPRPHAQSSMGSYARTGEIFLKKCRPARPLQHAEIMRYDLRGARVSRPPVTVLPVDTRRAVKLNITGARLPTDLFAAALASENPRRGPRWAGIGPQRGGLRRSADERRPLGARVPIF